MVGLETDLRVEDETVSNMATKVTRVDKVRTQIKITATDVNWLTTYYLTTVVVIC